MMINRHVENVTIYDPGADKTMLVFRVPDDHTYTVETVYAVTNTTLAAGTVNYFTLQLLNGGTAGTSTTAISDAIGGTPGWTASTPKAFTVTDGSGDLTAGQWLAVKLDETGTIPVHIMSVSIEYVDGIGSTA